MDNPDTITAIADAAVQTLFVPLDHDRDMMVLMVVIGPDADGRQVASRPYLDDIEDAALALAGRNWNRGEVQA